MTRPRPIQTEPFEKEGNGIRGQGVSGDVIDRSPGSSFYQRRCLLYIPLAGLPRGNRNTRPCLTLELIPPLAPPRVCHRTTHPTAYPLPASHFPRPAAQTSESLYNSNSGNSNTVAEEKNGRTSEPDGNPCQLSHGHRVSQTDRSNPETPAVPFLDLPSHRLCLSPRNSISGLRTNRYKNPLPFLFSHQSPVPSLRVSRQGREQKCLHLEA